MVVDTLQTKYEWPWACTWRDSLSQSFNVTTLQIYACQHYIFQNINILMIPVRVINTYISVSDLYSFITVDPVRMAPWCQNMKEFDTCHELYFMICILLSAFVCWHSKCKNTHSMSNIKFVNAQQAKDWQYTYNVTFWHIHMMFIPSQPSQ